MKFLIKKFFIMLFLLSILQVEQKVFAKENYIKYEKENISNYFSGLVSINQNFNKEAFEYLNKVRLKNKKHTKYNLEFVKTLVQLEKFDEAITFSENAWTEDELIFEFDLLLGLKFFLENDYINAEKHFERLNIISRYNLFFSNFVGNILIAWSKAYQGKEKESFQFIEKIPDPYLQIKKTQNVLLKCYFDDSTTSNFFKELIKDDKFSRYYFFYINYLLFNNQNKKANQAIKDGRKKYNSNLLLKQTENFILNNKNTKIKNLFNCKNPKDSLAEFFYVIANLYSSEENYKKSNFYIKISSFLNNKFLPNQLLLAENYYFQSKYKISKKTYKSLRSIGESYSWHAAKSIATILIDTKGKKYAVKSLQKEFNSITNPNFDHYYQLANFYKDNEYYEKSVEYYSLTLSKIKKDHFLVPKIFDRRGTSYERMGDWENAEKDLIKSLEILPDQAHVLNYLAYTWVDKGINLDKGLEMLITANEIKKNDGYIIDSLGWAYYAKENYAEAESFLQKAVELLPLDPIINDHYADTLWMLNKDIQARYFWNYVLKLDTTEKKLKDIINKKLIFGITKKL